MKTKNPLSTAEIICENCGRDLDEATAVMLELDQRTGTYTDQPVPAEFSQGAFAFGADCAKQMIAAHKLAHPEQVEQKPLLTSVAPMQGGEIIQRGDWVATVYDEAMPNGSNYKYSPHVSISNMGRYIAQVELTSIGYSGDKYKRANDERTARMILCADQMRDYLNRMMSPKAGKVTREDITALLDFIEMGER